MEHHSTNVNTPLVERERELRRAKGRNGCERLDVSKFSMQNQICSNDAKKSS